MPTTGASLRQKTEWSIQDLARGFGEAHRDGNAVDSDEVQALTRRQYDWITAGRQGTRPGAEQFVGLGEMYGAVDPSASPDTACLFAGHGEPVHSTRLVPYRAISGSS